MPATVADLAARALRRLGVEAVAASDRPGPGAGASVPLAEVGRLALRRLGVQAVPRSERPANPADTLTLAEIGRLALEWIGAVASGEATDPADAERAETKARAVHDGLAAQGVVSWGAGYAIPSSVSEDYVMLVALHLAPSFGKAADPEAVPRIEARIRRIALLARAEEEAEAAAQAVHDALAARGLAPWWRGQAAPREALDEYVRLTALRLAPAFGADAGPDEAEALEQRVRRLALLLGSQALAEQAVADAHASLDARGRVRWTLFDLPDFAEGPYVALAANLLAPQFGLPADELAEARAARELAQAVALPSAGEPMRQDYF